MSTQASTSKQRQAALYGITAVHAAFGDVELAQMSLRGERCASFPTSMSLFLCLILSYVLWS